MTPHLPVAPSRNFFLLLGREEEESQQRTNIRILGILFAHAPGICFGLEICTLKAAFEKQIIHSVSFFVAASHKSYLSRFEKLHVYLNVNHSEP